MTGLDALPGKSHYFIGRDRSKWLRNVPRYAKVGYEGVYPGIDLVFYGTDQRQLEYDFMVAPGADPSAITLGIKGAEGLEIDAGGDLVIHMIGGEVRLLKPFVYQEVDGARRIVSGRYALQGDDQVGFAVAAYDASRPLIIDPVLAYSTYLGGSGTDSASRIAVDGAGNAYVTGQTSSVDFPAEGPSPDGPLQAYFGGGTNDVFVTKVKANGTALVYSTYLGGNRDDQGFGIAVDGAGNAYVTGWTDSTNFPTGTDAFQVVYGGGESDAFVAKLNPAGDVLVYSTYLGGSDGDAGYGVAVDTTGNAYVAGWTNSLNFPTTASAFQTSFGDAFVTKLDGTGSALMYSTYLSVNGEAEVGEIAVDAAGNAYVVGSLWFFNGDTAAMVVKFDASGSKLVYFNTFRGTRSDGSLKDFGFGIAVDGDGNAYVTGWTKSPDFPTTENAFQPVFAGGKKCSRLSCPGDVFVAKLDPDGALVYSSYLGGKDGDTAYDIAVDSAGSAYLTGVTASKRDFPTADPFQPAFGGGYQDAFVAKVDATGSALLYSSYLGGSGTDIGLGIAVDGDGNAYVTGWTTSTDFPTADPFQPAFGGSSDAFVAKVSGGGTEEPSGITLAATGYKVKGLQKADLEWSGATLASVDIYRDGGLITTTANDGFYTDNINQKGGGSYTYQVCEAGTSTCSNEATVTF
jgi:hypothetical protein